MRWRPSPRPKPPGNSNSIFWTRSNWVKKQESLINLLLFAFIWNPDVA